MEVQGGTMKISIEDDIFRVVIRWKRTDGEKREEADTDVETEDSMEPAGGMNAEETGNS